MGFGMICDKYRGKRDNQEGLDDGFAGREEEWQREAFP
jgi:hypothetical protein